MKLGGPIIITATLVAAVLGYCCCSARSAEISVVGDYSCNGQEYTAESNFQASLSFVFTDLISTTPTKQLGYDFYDVSPLITGGPPVYGHAHCEDSIGLVGCADCLSTAKDLLVIDCPARIGGWVYMGGCFMRYETYPIN